MQDIDYANFVLSSNQNNQCQSQQKTRDKTQCINVEREYNLWNRLKPAKLINIYIASAVSLFQSGKMLRHHQIKTLQLDEPQQIMDVSQLDISGNLEVDALRLESAYKLWDVEKNKSPTRDVEKERSLHCCWPAGQPWTSKPTPRTSGCAGRP